MPLQEGEWTAEDFVRYFPKAAPSNEWTAEDFAGFFPKKRASTRRPIPPMSPEETATFQAGIQPSKPPNALESLLGRGLEGTASVLRGTGEVFDYLASAQPANPGVTKGGTQPGLFGPGYAQGPQVGANVAGALAGPMESTAESIYPKEVRGTGGFLSEDLPGVVGDVVPMMAASLVNPALGLATAGMQSGAQSYFDILAKTGDKDKAIAGLLATGAASVALEKIGFGGQFGRIVKKLRKIDDETGGAVSQLALLKAIGGGGVREQATEVVDQGLSGIIREQLGNQDVAILDEMMQVAKSPEIAALGGFGGSLESVVDASKAKKGKIVSPGAPDAAQGDPASASLVAHETEAPPAAPTDVARPAPAPARTVNDIGPETAPGGADVQGEGGTLPPSPVPANGIQAKAQSLQQGPETASAAPTVEKKPAPDAEPDEGTIEMMAGLPPLRGWPQTTPAPKGKGLASKLYEGLVKTHGGKPEDAALMEERARGEVEVEAKRARSAVLAMKRAVRRHNRTAGATKVTNADLYAALTDPEAMAKLPDSVRSQAQRMRDQSDNLSRIMVNEGMTSETMSEVVEGRMGQYMRRSYKAHVDPKWGERVPPDVRNRLESLLVSWSQPTTPEAMSALKARAKAGDRAAAYELGSRKGLAGKSVDDIRAEMSKMLQDAKRVAENPFAAFAKSKLKRQDVSLFKARKGLPEEMRAFLGEEKDPYRAYTTTILKQARYVATNRKFREMRAVALGKWLHEKPVVRDGVEYTARVSAEDNPRLEPLVGDKELFTTEDIKKALFDADRQMVSATWRTFMVANAVLKAGRTVYQVYAVPKQAASQVTALVSNGHAGYAVAHPKEIVAGMYGIGGAGKALNEDLTRLQVLDSSVAAAEYKDVQEAMANRELRQPWKGMAQANEWMGAMFSQPDNFAKTAGYLKELQRLEKAGITGEAAKREAANRVRNLYPTYSRITSIVDKWRRQPFLGTYMAYKAEQARTSFERLKLISKDLKSENPVLKRQAVERAGMWLAGLALPKASAIAWNMLNGVDQEDDERRRDRVREHAPYDAERNLAWVNDGKDYIDLSDVDDGAWLTDPIMRIIQGADVNDVFMEMWRENIEPFGIKLGYSKEDGTTIRPEVSMAIEAIAEWAQGRDKYGKPIKDDWEWFKKKITPPSIQRFDIRDLTGLRVRPVN